VTTFVLFMEMANLIFPRTVLIFLL